MSSQAAAASSATQLEDEDLQLAAEADWAAESAASLKDRLGMIAEDNAASQARYAVHLSEMASEATATAERIVRMADLTAVFDLLDRLLEL